MLSANRVAEVKVPELLDYVTLKTMIERTEFEEKSKFLLDKVATPVEQALTIAGLTNDDIQQVEIVGGGLRIPRVSELIKEATQKSELMVHLNGDEAMSFGSSFIAANSSSQYKVRKVYLTQRPSFDIQVKIRPLVEMEEANLENSEITYKKDFTLFKTSDYLGIKKTINLSYDVDMLVQAYAIHPDGSEEHLLDVQLKEIEKTANSEAAKKEGSTTPKVSLSFELNRSQILKVTKAEVKFDELVRTEIKPEPVKKSEEKKEETD